LNWRVQATALLLYLSYLQTGAQTAFLTGKRPITTQGSYSNTGTYYKAQHCTSLITRSVHIKGEHAHHNYSKGPAMEESQGSCFHKISEWEFIIVRGLSPWLPSSRPSSLADVSPNRYKSNLSLGLTPTSSQRNCKLHQSIYIINIVK
jgi:hypothetical protein